LEIVKQNGFALEDVKQQTTELCLAAVWEDGFALKYVQNQTAEICLAAVKQYGYSLKYVQNQTAEICLAAIQEDRCALEDVNSEFYSELRITLLAVYSWKLFYYQGKYHAGCRGPWSAEQALNHWNECHHVPERATLFREAIVEHEKQLNKIT
jgi:hypothetical protein